MKISMEVGVIAPMRCHKMINGSKLLIFSSRSWDFGIEDFFRTRCGECGECGQPAGWLASQKKVPPSPGLIIISIIIIVMIVKLLIISSISTISFIHICNMNDINNIYALTIMAPPL